MSDLHTLHDAFAELERRADAASADMRATRPRRALGLRLVPVAATVVVVAGLAAGAVWITGGGSAPQAGGPPSTTATTTSETRSPMPRDPDELLTRFRAALGDAATVEVTEGVTDSRGPVITGLLTSAAGTGGFDLRMFVDEYPSDPEETKRNCDETPGCETSTLPDGSELMASPSPLEGTAVGYGVGRTWPDGRVLQLAVSNQESPKGMGQVFGPQPPLTRDQAKAIVTSDQW
ncbi:hypothetical protein [Actinophytocola oryzae]|uniref:Uncharacterized protein n=1 Tax=Actinophytocola oryzae TaxID=502181 RepID=A0A4R7VDD2_9PSEU|nr:hypothetical protein [Actinophytocola oryzae]TDV46989.1 hypothetical protein CLV71_110172 [Actinophytocola oryzae]